MDPKPVIRCLLGKHVGYGQYIVRVGDPVTLEEAEAFIEVGWRRILDPADEAAVARWERLQKPRSWRQWSGRD